MQVAGLDTTPGRSFGGDQVMWKLSGVLVQVKGPVTTHVGILGDDQVSWKLPGVVVQVTGLVTTLALEEVIVLTRSCGSCQGSLYR